MTEPAPSVVDHRRALDGWHLAATLGEVAANLRLYVVMDQHQLDACALWVAHTWLHDVSDASPFLHIASPEKRSGKTRLLEVLELLVREPLLSASISPAAIFRIISQVRPTLLLDEFDATVHGSSERLQEIRQLLDAGHRRGQAAVRCVPPTMKAVKFDVYCPKVLAGIGELPDTLADRSIRIELRRKAKSEHVQRFRRRQAKAGAVMSVEGTDYVQDRFDRYALDWLKWLAEWPDPVLPHGLDDRAEDLWEPLLAIAELAGNSWPERAASAALALSGGREDTETEATQLLALVAQAIGTQPYILTHDLLRQLAADDSGPWHKWWDTKEDAPTRSGQMTLARWLKPFGGKPKNTRHVAPDGSQSIVRAYHREDLSDSIMRYLPDRPPSSTTERSQQLLLPHS